MEQDIKLLLVGNISGGVMRAEIASIIPLEYPRQFYVDLTATEC